MTIKQLEKLAASGDALRKTLDHLNGVIAGLETKVRELEAQSLVSPPTTYRLVEKSHDDPLAERARRPN